MHGLNLHYNKYIKMEYPGVEKLESECVNWGKWKMFSKNSVFMWKHRMVQNCAFVKYKKNCDSLGYEGETMSLCAFFASVWKDLTCLLLKKIDENAFCGNIFVSPWKSDLTDFWMILAKLLTLWWFVWVILWNKNLQHNGEMNIFSHWRWFLGNNRKTHLQWFDD